METVFCPSCGTEVDETALFCPSCGQALEPADAIPPSQTPAPGPAAREGARAAAPEPPRAAPPPPPRPGNPAASRPPRESSGVTISFTTPLMLSGWLVGGGGALAALGAFIGLFDRVFNPIDALLLPAFLLLAAAVFLLAERVAGWPHIRIATLAVTLVGFGVAIDRIGFGIAGLGELLVFLGAGAAAIGAILAEIGLDQPLGAGRD